jgi:peptidoglycan glycosyltransferase
MVTASAALDSGTFSKTDVFSDPGHFTINGFTVHNAEHEVTGTQTFVGAFALSSNVDFAHIGTQLGVDTFYDYLHRYHVGDDNAMALATSRDEVPAKTAIVPSELAQMAFGQGGLAVTPLRMALIGATIANNGVLMRPQLVKQIRTPGRAPFVVPPVEWEQVISPITANDIRDMMVAVVNYGTGTAAQLHHVVVAGKTGTATHPGGPPDAWFVCFAPADNPRLVVAVVVEDVGYGGQYAAPIARRILTGALPLYNH